MRSRQVSSAQLMRNMSEESLLKKKTYLSISILAGTLLYFLVTGTIDTYNDLRWQPVYAPTVRVAGAAITPTPTPTEREQIEAYIKEVFQADSAHAFKLLSCENASLNPGAVNTAGNYPAGSRDIGIFQINEYWQKIQAKFLFDWKINIQVAHLLYRENNNSFKLWTCGRKLGI